MKGSLIIALLLLSASYSFAQNTFPANGNVGVGTVTPNAPLQINGASNGFTGGRNSIVLNSIYGGSNEITFIQNGVVKWEMGNDLGANGSNDFYLFKASPTGYFPLYVGGNSNVGIGTINPQQALQIGDNSTGTIGLRIAVYQ